MVIETQIEFWPLADAKNRLSELVDRLDANGPQVITRRGDAVAVVVSHVEWQRLMGQQPSLLAYLTEGPDFADLDLARDGSGPREIDFDVPA